MSIELWLAFVGASAILLVLPGPTILTVISYSVAHGRRANVPLVAAVSATGQMLTKTMLFGLARRAPGRLKGKARAALDRAAGAIAARGGAATSLIFASAVTGVPPFYGVSLAAGALGMRLRSFLVGGAAGRLLRFAAIAWAARLAGEGATGLFASLAPAAAAVGG